MRSAIVTAALGILLGGCAGKVATETILGARQVAFLYQSNRQGEMEPCGCQSKPYGGIAREANAVQKVREDGRIVWYVDAGNTFSPPRAVVGPDHQKRKARAIAKMLSTMKVDVVAPGPNDYYLGNDFLSDLRKESGLHFVSTNVESTKGEAIFERYFESEKQGMKVVFLSLSPQKLLAPGVVVRDPVETLEDWLPKVSSDRFVVLLSQLGSETDEKIASRFPGLKLIIGADDNLALEEPFWFGGKTLVLDPHRLGYQLGRLDLEWVKPFQGFYSPSNIAANRARLESWQNRLAADPSNKMARQYVDRILKQDSLHEIEGGTRYSNKLISLDEAGYGTANEVTSLVKEYRESVRQAAIRAAE